jgi:hypothetical protein
MNILQHFFFKKKELGIIVLDVFSVLVASLKNLIVSVKLFNFYFFVTLDKKPL